MALSEQAIAVLILKFISRDISPGELGQLQEYLDASPAHRRHFEELTRLPVLQARLREFYNSADTEREEAGFQRIMERIREERIPGQQAPPVKHYSFKWVRYAAAAIIILSAGYLTYQLAGKRSDTETIKPLASSQANDVLPGSDKAVLTLADGSAIVIDKSARTGLLTQQGTTKINKLGNGELAYNAGKPGSNMTIVYNTLTTPRSGQFKVQLPDGTLVWLNNASSLHYPTVFSGTERRVELTGEAYFEVARDKAHPFKVTIQPGASGQNGGTVEVLGTHFNIMAYPDESHQKTTLLEGSIKFLGNNVNNGTAVLKPGQQVDCNTQGQLKIIKEVDTEETIAWKNGYFHFLHADVSTVMRQLARWYDVEVIYEGNGISVKDFNGKIPRNTHLADVLEVLKMNKLDCRIEGKKLIVKE